jgi:hypothetical protein
MGRRFVLSEEEKKEIQEKYKKSPYYTMQSFNMGDLPDLPTSINMRAENYTAEYEEVFDKMAQREGRLVVVKVLNNLLDRYSKK